MAYRSAGYMEVKAADLPKAPAAFQEYVRTYFAEVKKGGEPYFVAMATSGRLSPHRRSTEKGVAPTHSADVDQFTQGFEEGGRLSEWMRAEMRKARKGEDTILYTYNADWDDGTISCVVED